MIMNKKIIYGIISIALCGSMTSCDLDEPTYAKTTTENYYQIESQIQQALTGAYLQLRQTWNEYALNHYVLGDCSTDDALKGSTDGDKPAIMELQNFTVYTNNEQVNKRWNILYSLINRCNEVIAYAPKASGEKNTIERYVKEAKALRGFGYYSLVTTFGGVPLLLEPKEPAQILAIGRATTDEVYAQIEKDLTDAQTLPSKAQYAEADKYRVTRGFAKTMLAKTYMFLNDYTKAENVLRQIVEQDKDYDLLPDYGMNWRKEYENSCESVFELPNKIYDKTIATGTNVPHFFTSRDVSGYQGYGFHVPTTDLFEAFDVDDPRQTYVFTRTGDRYIGDTECQDNHQSATGFHDYKMTVPTADKQGEDVWMISYNIRMIRYADVLLLYAEALNENGKAQEALKYLNKVRGRARNTNPVDPRKDMQAYIPQTTAATLPDITVTAKDALRQAIWHERRVELAMEGWRRDDLMRQHRFGEVMRAYAAKYNVQKGRNFNDSRDYLLPIPQSEIDKSNGVLTQNTGY